MPLKTLILFTFLLKSSLAFAIVYEVEIPPTEKEIYIEQLIKDYPLPKDVRHYFDGQKLWIIGDGNKTWDGKTKAETDMVAK